MSLTFAVKLDVPLVVGVPDTTPVVAARVNPAGRLPDVTDHVYAGVPPLACRAWEYAVPVVPGAKAEEVMVRGFDEIWIEVEAEAVCVGLPESVTLTAKLNELLDSVVDPDTRLLAAGVPEMMPIDGERESPAGNCPDEMDQT